MDDTIVTAIDKLSSIWRYLQRERGREYGLTALQVQIVNFIQKYPVQYSTISNMAKEFELSKATISEAVKTLIQKKILEKFQSESDRRRSILKINTEGYGSSEALSHWSDGVLEQLGTLTDKEKLQGQTFLLDLILLLKKAGIINTVRMCLNCNNFIKNAYRVEDIPHFCTLLNQPISESNIEINCEAYIQRD